MNRRLLYGLIVAGLIVVVALVWFFVLNPMRNDIASTKDAIETEQTRLAAAQAKLAQAKVTRQEGRKNQARLLELAKMVPPSDEIPSLLLQIQALADQSGITFMAITPGDLIQSNDFQILPLQVEFTGTFFPLNDFLYRVERMAAGPGRLLATKQLNLQLGDLTADGQELQRHHDHLRLRDGRLRRARRGVHWDNPVGIGNAAGDQRTRQHRHHDRPERQLGALR